MSKSETVLAVCVPVWLARASGSVANLLRAIAAEAFMSASTTELVRFRIAEQKQALGSLIKILSVSTEAEVTTLTAQLTELAKIYDGIQFKYNFIEPVTDTTKKITYINSTTDVIVSDEQIALITNKIEEIRNKIINPSQS